MDRKRKQFHFPFVQSSSRGLSFLVPANLEAILKLNLHTEIISTLLPLHPCYSLLPKISLCIAKCKHLPSRQETESVTVLKVTKLERKCLHFAWLHE